MTLPHIAELSPEYRHPVDFPPPRGVKMQLYTLGGICVIGVWDPLFAVAWAPLTKMPVELKDRLRSEGKIR